MSSLMDQFNRLQISLKIFVSLDAEIVIIPYITNTNIVFHDDLSCLRITQQDQRRLQLCFINSYYFPRCKYRRYKSDRSWRV
jgi:hypothetical protein